jgi:hypothetical protein
MKNRKDDTDYKLLAIASVVEILKLTEIMEEIDNPYFSQQLVRKLKSVYAVMGEEYLNSDFSDAGCGESLIDKIKRKVWRSRKETRKKDKE